ncbi:MAG TPA: hypothetical protein VNO70_09370, partial [Blastocatellia bacterium]|nr:hypothetical protein [Blastocatellia bacterium]
MQSVSTKSRAVVGALILLLTAGLLALVIIPAFIILPFKAQTPRGLALSYAMRSWSPLVTVIGSAIVLALAVWLWRGSRWWGKGLL